MIIFLHGPDSYRAREKLNEIINHYKTLNKSSLNLIYFDAVKLNFSDFYNNFKISPIFSETKLIILKNVFENEKFQEDFLKELKILKKIKDVIIVFWPEKANKQLKLVKSLLQECKCQEFLLLDGKGVKKWAIKEFEKRKNKINNDALDFLVSLTGNNLWRISNEIKKLSNFKNGETIRKEDVKLLVKPDIKADIFKTIDFLAEKNKKQALELLQKHLELSDSPLYLLSMIAYQFRNLLMVKELANKGLMYFSIVKKSGLHPFVIRKTYFQARKFSIDDLQRIYKEIFWIDGKIKSGKIDQETALNLLIASL